MVKLLKDLQNAENVRCVYLQTVAMFNNEERVLCYLI